MSEEQETIKICSNHQDYPVPLIWTFIFPGAEYWCPYCSCSEGVLGAGEDVEATDELTGRALKYIESSKEYRKAMGERACSSMEYEGKNITYSELPQHEKDRGEKAIEDWRYGVKL